MKKERDSKLCWSAVKGLLIGGVAVAAAVVAWGCDYKLTTPCYTIRTPKVHKGFRIVQLSDLHSCWYGKGQKKLLELIRRQNPDIIVMTGDIADDDVPHDGTVALLEGLKNQYPCFYVTGNHEIWSMELEWLKDLFRSYGVVVLENEWQTIDIDNQLVNICGVEDTAIGMPVMSNLAEAFMELNEDLFTILLAHRPETSKAYLKFPADLILNGHAHGGQWIVPGHINGIFAPSEGLFPKYAGGLYNHSKAVQIVSRGLAKESTKVPRLFNPPEVVVVDVAPFENPVGV